MNYKVLEKLTLLINDIIFKLDCFEIGDEINFIIEYILLWKQLEILNENKDSKTKEIIKDFNLTEYKFTKKEYSDIIKKNILQNILMKKKLIHLQMIQISQIMIIIK